MKRRILTVKADEIRLARCTNLYCHGGEEKCAGIKASSHWNRDYYKTAYGQYAGRMQFKEVFVKDELTHYSSAREKARARLFPVWRHIWEMR